MNQMRFNCFVKKMKADRIEEKRRAGRPLSKFAKNGTKIIEDVRQRLLTAAVTLFARKGYSATSVREIVAEAKVTQPVLYYYFKNKEGIFLGLMEETAHGFDELLSTLHSKKGSVREKIIFLFESIIKLHAENIELVKIMHTLLYGPEESTPDFDFHKFPERLRMTVMELIKQGIKNKEFRKINVDDATWGIMGILKITLEAEHCHQKVPPGIKGMKRIVNLFLDGLKKI